MGGTSFGDLARVAGPTRRRPPHTFAAACRVAFSDTDAQGIVYYGRYAPYFDVARVEYFRHLGLVVHGSTETHGEFAMRVFEISYESPARFDDLLEVYCHVSKIGRSSLAFEFEVLCAQDERVLATARQVMVNVDMDTRRSTPVDAHVRSQIEAFEDGV